MQIRADLTELIRLCRSTLCPKISPSCYGAPSQLSNLLQLLLFLWHLSWKQALLAKTDCGHSIEEANYASSSYFQSLHLFRSSPTSLRLVNFHPLYFTFLLLIRNDCYWCRKATRSRCLVTLTPCSPLSFFMALKKENIEMEEKAYQAQCWDWRLICSTFTRCCLGILSPFFFLLDLY